MGARLRVRVRVPGAVGVVVLFTLSHFLPPLLAALLHLRHREFAPFGSVVRVVTYRGKTLDPAADVTHRTSL